MSIKDSNAFDTLFKRGDKISDGLYRATTAKRKTLVIPEGVKVYDTDLDKMFVGDGATAGGSTDNARLSVRTVVVPAASSASVVSGTDVFTWAQATYLRTGDAVTLAAGTGAIPSGLSATTYYIIKVGDVGDGSSNTGTTFKLATTRQNALARTAIDVLGPGTDGWTAVTAAVAVKGFEDIMFISPVVALDVILPDANSSEGKGVTIKKTNASVVVTIKEADASGNVAASGSVTIDDATGYITLRSANADSVSLFADATNGKWYSWNRHNA